MKKTEEKKMRNKMKAISQGAEKVMNTLTENLNSIGDHKKIDHTNGTFMPVSVACVNKCEAGIIFSVTHYYEQNGDLMRDPDMEFIRGEDGKYYPISFWQDGGFPTRDEAVKWESGEIKGVQVKLQAKLVTFANKWLKNIKEQQNT